MHVCEGIYRRTKLEEWGSTFGALNNVVMASLIVILLRIYPR